MGHQKQSQELIANYSAALFALLINCDTKIGLLPYGKNSLKELRFVSSAIFVSYIISFLFLYQNHYFKQNCIPKPTCEVNLLHVSSVRLKRRRRGPHNIVTQPRIMRHGGAWTLKKLMTQHLHADTAAPVNQGYPSVKAQFFYNILHNQ